MGIEYTVFPREEYKTRCKRARNLMEKRGLGALLVTGDGGADENLHYFASMRAGRRRPGAMILPQDGEPVLIMDWSLKKLAGEEATWINDIRTYEYEGLKAELIKDTLDDLGLSKSKIGAELNDSHDAFRINMRYVEFQRLQRKMSNAEFVDASEILWKLRMMKSEAETEYLRTAGSITSKSYDAWFSSIKEGMTEIEAMETLKRLFEEHGCRTYEVGLAGRAAQGLPRTPLDRSLKKGDWLRIDGGAQFKGYRTDFSRAGVIGEPSEKQKKTWEMAVELVQKCLEVVKSGVRVSDIVRVAIEAQRSLGLPTDFLRKYHMGHGIGLSIPEPPMVMIADDTKIEAGMTLAIEPMWFLGSAVSEQDFIVEEGGYELISTASTDLHSC